MVRGVMVETGLRFRSAGHDGPRRRDPGGVAVAETACGPVARRTIGNPPEIPAAWLWSKTARGPVAQQAARDPGGVAVIETGPADPCRAWPWTETARGPGAPRPTRDPAARPWSETARAAHDGQPTRDPDVAAWPKTDPNSQKAETPETPPKYPHPNPGRPPGRAGVSRHYFASMLTS